MDWSASWRDAFRIELRAEAIGLAGRAWPVFPGTYLDDSLPAGNQWVGRTGHAEHGPVPVREDWRAQLPATLTDNMSWWAARPYSLLLATGLGIDVIEVDAELGRAVAGALRRTGRLVPTLATPDGRWLFLVESGAPMHSELAEREGILLHAADSWVPLAPSPLTHGVVHWRVKPETCDWNLLPSDEVQAIVAEVALGLDPVLEDQDGLVGADR
ncbi:bifunctional DNA primase/polymerase [Actinoalloteichus hymeniacidonis]|uniref:DNA primase/polymerase bifunctional N-terminal domain-containing protein n=1 Tax=Actinoalloteichus hymeniacidonis TaxID=340345 RepID=A0AAC9HKL1_9PSEU|nr:bifunctional DNA primase/polymerase [Actinoalloteichus hymeniacidonis]AOS61137.1 hypothetical protein TL08_01485 [Actinoalloteichus hymeniacidonis]MBB5910862.1 hypothetical protein [Actinoalloteichus hymeniacidonis]